MKVDADMNIRFIVLIFFLVFTVAPGFSLEISDEKELTVFVDRSTGEIIVNNPATTNYEIQLFDLTGKEVLRSSNNQETSTTRIQTSQLRKGIYLVRVIPVNGASPITVKVMIR